ncbi:MAG: arginine deiminase-related protein [Desulfobacterales bacterium]|nr:arginine deiminase-related protein [Desulfobacterales bacterium]
MKISKTIDLTHYCKQNKALEGTGSMVLDRIHKVAFASLSPRTNRVVLEDFCNKLGYRSVVFHSYDKEKLIYHSNVMMSIGTDYAVICTEAIKDETEKKTVLNELKKLGKRIIEISPEQMNHMCGNILELHAVNGEKKIIMSTSAYNHFSIEQKKKLEKSGDILSFDVHTIENIGGGGVRCMVAEIFY